MRAPIACPPPLRVGEQTLCFERERHLMGIVNVTPDSFSDGGLYASHERAVAHALELLAQGAAVVDIGGESTRPGAQPVSLSQELERVLPVLEAVAAARPEAILSIDTTKAEVARRAIKAGARLVNDISGLTFEPELGHVVAAHQDVGLILMHTRGRPDVMQRDLRYEDVVSEVLAALERQVELAQSMGVARSQLMVDPGLGFAKDAAQSYTLMRELPRLVELGLPVLVGPSRKSFIGAVTQRPAQERVMGTAAAVACCLMAGAHMVRVHDVSAMLDVLRVTQAIRGLA